MRPSSTSTSSSSRRGSGLRRTVGLQRTGFRRKPDSAPRRRYKPMRRVSPMVMQPAHRPTATVPIRSGECRGTYAGTTTVPLAKPRARRRARVLQLARGMPCLLQVPEVCNRDRTTTVACHSNWSEHGKAGARRADDCYSVWGCSACHAWLDQGGSGAEVKRPIFDTALLRQIEWWERVAADPARPEPDRRAARWAIDQLARDVAATAG